MSDHDSTDMAEAMGFADHLREPVDIDWHKKATEARRLQDERNTASARIVGRLLVILERNRISGPEGTVRELTADVATYQECSRKIRELL